MTSAGPNPGGQRFGRKLRLRSRAEFDRVMRGGVRVADQRLTLWALGNELEHARLGLVVGRRHGGAVGRSRLRRLLREAFRTERERLPAGLDLVCSPRPGERLSLAGAVESLVALGWRARSRLVKGAARTGEERSPE